jgi:hypothetical protein
MKIIEYLPLRVILPSFELSIANVIRAIYDTKLNKL